jgi:putative peptidoglycan lipid II flippase
MLREVLMASAFGASASTDAFNVAFRIPNLLRRLFAEGAFSQAFVPVLAGTRAREGEAAARELTDAVASVLLWVLVITCFIGVAAAPLLVWAMASGMSGAALEASALMTRVMFPYIACMSLVALAAGILNTHKKFAVPAATPVLLNVAMIAGAWLGAPAFAARGIEPIYAMAAGVMLGGVLQLVVQIWALKRMGLWPKLAWNPHKAGALMHSSHVHKIGSLMLPALLGVGVAQISLLINTQIASHQIAGSVSWLSYADRLMEFPVAMLGVALGVVLTPSLSAAKASGDDAKYSAMIDWGLRWVLLLCVPCAIALLVFGQPLVASLYHYGKFTPEDVRQTTLALGGYGVGLLGLVAIKILAPAYFASQDVKTPVKIAVAVLVITQLLNFVFVPMFAHAGLALSIGVGALINALWLWVGLYRRGIYKPEPGWGMFALQVLAASALLAIGLIYFAQSFDWVNGWRGWARFGLLLGVISISGAVYLGTCLICGVRWREFVRH